MARTYSNLLLDMVAEGMIDATEVVKMLIVGIPEDEVKRIFLANQLDEGVPSDIMANYEYNEDGPDPYDGYRDAEEYWECMMDQR